MGKLVYSIMCSLDGYVADPDGNFDWAEPDEEVHTYVNDRQRQIGLHLYGRRMYEVLAVWEADDWMVDEPAYIHDYATVWRSADKIVYSRTLEEANTSRTRIERRFDPGTVPALKAGVDRDVMIGGPELAAQALRGGVVDEIELFVAPVVVGAGHAALPPGLRLPLELIEERRFSNGMVALRYRTLPASA